MTVDISMGTAGMDPRLRARRIEVMRLAGRRRLRRLALVVAVVVTAVIVFATLRSSLFDVDTIAVEGIEETQVEEVLALAEPLLSQPLLEVESWPIADQIAAMPWVDEVSTSRSIDGTLTFELTERTAVAALTGPDGWLLVDADGRVLDIVAELPATTPVIDGSVWNAQPGEWIPERALPAIELATALPASLAADVAAVLADDQIELVLFGGGSVILGDDTELENKFLATVTMLSQVPLDCLERIDVRAPTVPVLTRVPDCS